ncbi:hypothetical protein ALP29_200683 [Pseudomonas syringae pv. avii]|uniref:Uncharacterized protein n=1 Tax=Pseudomonas syringae pv. avii TaxID=663959 RepID=A0A3M5V163_PSESX|nr:hypothetical protein ALP29_200683 [Pseudomonas syringae pv. avii]
MISISALQCERLDGFLPPDVSIGELDAVNLIPRCRVAQEVIHHSQVVGSAVDPENQIIASSRNAYISCIEADQLDRVHLACSSFIGVVNNVLT